jgi:hypothetical protein
MKVWPVRVDPHPSSDTFSSGQMHMMLSGRAIRVFAMLMLLTACAAPQTKALRKLAVTPPVQLADVPFFPQQDYQCGPAALASMLSWSGRPVTPELLVPEVYVPGRKGSLGVELVAATRRHGRLMYPLSPTMEGVLTALEQGYPVLVLQNNGLGIYPVWHFTVVTGADRARELLWLHSGKTRQMAVSFSAFERTWARAGYWATLVFDPARFPSSLDAPVVVRELALMEQAGAVKEAQAGFARVVITWPEQKTGWLGLAASSMTLGDFRLAESTLRELVRRQPQYGAGLNNLADLLLKTGRAEEALSYAERAVAVLDIPATRATLTAAHAARAARPAPSLAPVQGH